MSAAGDPFYVVKDELSEKVSALHSRHSTFKRLLETTNTATSAEFKECRKAFARELKSAEKQMRDLTLTVDLVKNDRQQFPHIDDYELEQRSAFIVKTKKVLSEITASFKSEGVKAKMVADERKEIESRPAANLGATSSDQMEHTHFIHDQQAEARMIISQQDEDLEELGQGVDRLHEMGQGINEELKQQNKMLNELDRDLDEAAEKMNFVMGKLAKLLKTKDTCQIWTIIILTLVLVLLIFLVIYT
mmetsp:Transcript_46486/g.105014  ORF Transcript_46486/g.105014 Transcript_46486/m.105014 type:complete len:247 (+) Transcript_46486:144-884(+)|eukprot:CAMPEP_0172587632 /NCGR_PEP_ID=MMETSP1068-20121228/6650_1 /TAXON_ID=35684 /ORGANISM="Pseudopedinella elastica, Strain CCMP716" /LENGTH=246 /DNA_ID=CAMNT_0013382709 /DNA_START=144 /DNA_END=884 /DNA_ORIENTATION=+